MVVPCALRVVRLKPGRKVKETHHGQTTFLNNVLYFGSFVMQQLLLSLQSCFLCTVVLFFARFCPRPTEQPLDNLFIYLGLIISNLLTTWIQTPIDQFGQNNIITDCMVLFCSSVYWEGFPMKWDGSTRYVPTL